MHVTPPPCKSRDTMPLKRQLMEKYWILSVQSAVVPVLNKEWDTEYTPLQVVF